VDVSVASAPPQSDARSDAGHAEGLRGFASEMTEAEESEHVSALKCGNRSYCFSVGKLGLRSHAHPDVSLTDRNAA